MPLFLHVLKKKRGQIQNLQNEIHWRLREMMHLKGFHTTWHIMCSNITARFMYYISVSLLECSPHQIQTRDHFFLSGSFSPLSLSPQTWRTRQRQVPAGLSPQTREMWKKHSHPRAQEQVLTNHCHAQPWENRENAVWLTLKTPRVQRHP